MDQTRGQIANSKLVRSLKAGNPLAFREVYNLFEKKLYVFAFSITKSSYISEEIIQEVFIRIWERRELIDPNRSFDSYIFTITRNLVYNYLRDASRREDIRNEFWFNIKEQHQRSEEHTSELQSRGHLVCRLLLEKKKKHRKQHKQV